MRMKRNLSKTYNCFISVCFIIILLIPVFMFSSCLYLLLRPAPVYETNDIADYRIVTGNYDNVSPQKFVSSFFPERIEEYFSEVTYHYKAKKGDTYAYEMYLEFVIEDTDKYTTFLSNVIGDEVCESFYFDPTYQAYYVSNNLELHRSNDTYSIIGAKVGVVLFSDEEQRIVFTALGMYDGGGANVDDLNFFFNRFGINPTAFVWQGDGFIIRDYKTGDGTMS